MALAVYDCRRDRMSVRELRVNSSTQYAELTPSSGYCLRVHGIFAGNTTVSSLLTATVRSTLAFGSGHTTVASAILWSGRADQISDTEGVFLGPIDVTGATDQKIRFTNVTYSGGLMVNRAVIYFTEVV